MGGRGGWMLHRCRIKLGNNLLQQRQAFESQFAMPFQKRKIVLEVRTTLRSRRANNIYCSRPGLKIIFIRPPCQDLSP